MCGIVGIASRDCVPERGFLKLASDAIAHRGPDDAGEWWSDDSRVGLAHRRLAIVDLSSAGHQPMRDPLGGTTIVFNGEIYNFLDLQRQLAELGHTFRSHSDTEVILAAYRQWGVECLARLNGMFAFAIYDEARQRLFLARDRAGEKPLFYAVRNGALVFASELKALMETPAFPRRIDPEALDLYLAIGYVPGENCILQDARKLPAAHALLFDLGAGSARCWRYWQLPDPPTAQTAGASDQDLLQSFETLLEDAVRRQMQADVPVGVLLSGGVDSSLITAMAVRASSQVNTFTVGFSDFANYDESPHARLIARHFGTRHLELKADHIEPELLARLARQYDEPMLDSSMLPTFLVSQLVRQHCTVALGGDGGDELFGGYIHHGRLLWTQERFGRLPTSLRRAAASLARVVLPTGFRGRNWLQSLACDFNRSLPLIAAYFDGKERQQLMQGSAPRPWPLVAESVWRARIPAVEDLLQRVTRLEFATYMADDILVKVDRASMLNSLEVRAPLLDHRMIEFAFGQVPSRLKATPHEKKILLKRLATKVLPPEFDRQRKQGFSIPLAAWLKAGPWRSYFRDVLLDQRCMFDRKSVAQLFLGQDRGRHNQERLFGLVQFELWRREYGATL